MEHTANVVQYIKLLPASTQTRSLAVFRIKCSKRETQETKKCRRNLKFILRATYNHGRRQKEGAAAPHTLLLPARYPILNLEIVECP